jgi:hypothetical protein
MTSSSRRSEQGHVAQEKISPRGGGSAAVDFFYFSFLRAAGGRGALAAEAGRVVAVVPRARAAGGRGAVVPVRGLIVRPTRELEVRVGVWSRQ